MAGKVRVLRHSKHSHNIMQFVLIHVVIKKTVGLKQLDRGNASSLITFIDKLEPKQTD